MKVRGKNRIIKMMLVCLLAITMLIGCGSSNGDPEDSVAKGLDALIQWDQDALEECFVNLDMDELLEFEDEEDYLKAMFKNVEYKINDSSIDGDEAIVETEISNVDFLTIMEEWMEEMMELDYDELMALTEEEMMDSLFDEIANSDKDKITTTVDVKLVKEDGNWKIADDDDFYNALYGDLMDGLY